MQKLFDFTDPAVVQRWRPMNDRVMGGVSMGALEPTAEGARFCGEVSFERNGGFASVRASVETIDLSGASGLELELRGDGKRYRLNFHAETDPSSLLHRAPFETRSDGWQRISIPFDAFQPTVRGRLVRTRSAGRSAIDSFGLMIADRQEGPFSLELRSIAVVQP